MLLMLQHCKQYFLYNQSYKYPYCHYKIWCISFYYRVDGPMMCAPKRGELYQITYSQMPLWLLRRRSLSCAYRRKCRWCRLHSNRYHTGCNLYRRSQWDKWLKINNELVEVSPVGCFGLDLTLADPGDSSDVPRSNICHFLAVLGKMIFVNY